MTAWRRRTPRPVRQPFDDARFAPAAAPRAEHGANPVAGRGEWQKHRRALPRRDAVALRAEPFDDQLDDFALRRCRGCGPPPHSAPAYMPSDGRGTSRKKPLMASSVAMAAPTALRPSSAGELAVIATEASTMAIW